MNRSNFAQILQSNQFHQFETLEMQMNIVRVVQHCDAILLP